jgi:hypothetical protein
VERANLTLQDRLVKQLRLEGISTLSAANDYARAFIADYNCRFAKPPRSEVDLHRPLWQDEDLDLIFTVRELRKVSHVLTLQYDKTLYLLADTPFTRALIGQYIDVYDYPDGRVEAPKTSVLSLLRALVQIGYVRSEGMRYQLGDEARVLGTLIAAQSRFPDTSQLPQIAQPFLRLLAERSGETVFVSSLTEDRQESFYVARAESNHSIRSMAEIGERRPLYSSSGGRALLAYMPEVESAQYINRMKPVKLANKSVIDKKVMREMIVEIRRTGIAMTCDDTISACQRSRHRFMRKAERSSPPWWSPRRRTGCSPRPSS